MLTSLSNNHLGSLLKKPDQAGISPLAELHSIAKSNQLTAIASSAPVVSGTSVNSNTSSRWSQLDRLVSAAEADPSYAEQMAKAFAYIPDKMTQNWADAPSPANAEAFNAWANQSVEFDKEAVPVNAKRIELYSSMKSQGASDVDVLKAVLNFNSNQSAQYQIKTGFWKLDVKA